ncbi:MAG: hypothetical protein R6U35_07795 [Candidatus Humimicrobiaceae bacterium]
MGLFKKKKQERPKNPLGAALYSLDNLLNINLRKIKAAILNKKEINPRRAKKVFDRNLYKLDRIIEDISKENLKTDYRSDKVRYKVIGLIKDLKKYFDAALTTGFDYRKIEAKVGNFENILKKRENLKKDMKDIESDYF